MMRVLYNVVAIRVAIIILSGGSITKTKTRRDEVRQNTQEIKNKQTGRKQD